MARHAARLGEALAIIGGGQRAPAQRKSETAGTGETASIHSPPVG
jgi:hypothetical protein